MDVRCDYCGAALTANDLVDPRGGRPSIAMCADEQACLDNNERFTVTLTNECDDSFDWEFALDELECVLGSSLTTDSKWTCEGLPLWNRKLTGTFTASSVREWLSAVTVSGGWRLRVTRKWTTNDGMPREFAAVLWHHDVPTGATMCVMRQIDDEDGE
jgi:hypothetical protein